MLRDAWWVFQLPVTWQCKHLEVHQLEFHMVIEYLQMYGLEWLIETKPSHTWGNTPEYFTHCIWGSRIEDVGCSTGISDVCLEGHMFS